MFKLFNCPRHHFYFWQYYLERGKKKRNRESTIFFFSTQFLVRMGLRLDLRIFKLQDTRNQEVRTHYGSAVTGDRWVQPEFLLSLEDSTPDQGGTCSSPSARALRGPYIIYVAWGDVKCELKCKHLNLETEKAPSQPLASKHLLKKKKTGLPWGPAASTSNVLCISTVVVPLRSCLLGPLRQLLLLPVHSSQ